MEYFLGRNSNNVNYSYQIMYPNINDGLNTNCIALNNVFQNIIVMLVKENTVQPVLNTTYMKMSSFQKVLTIALNGQKHDALNPK